MKPYTHRINDAQYQLDLIAFVFDKYEVTFSKTLAARLVGGETRLEKLVLAGEIRADKPTAKQNGKWHCKGSDVLKHVRL